MRGGAGPAADRAAGRSGGRGPVVGLGRAAGPVVGLCVAGGAIRFATLGQQSFWLDEAVTGRLMRLGFGAMVRAIPQSESTPPAYYVLAWVWTRVFGVSEVGLRSLSAVLGVLTIGLLYAAGARLLDRRAGIVAAALGSFAPLMIWYSQEARSYALVVAVSAAGLWAFAVALEPGAGRRSLWAWAAAGAVALATHYFAVFLVGPELCWLVWKRGRPAVAPAAVVIVAGLALAPLAIHQRANGGAGFIARTALSTRLEQAVKQLALGYDAPADTLLVILGALLGLCVVWLAWQGWREGDESRRRVVVGLAGLAGLAVLLPVGLAVVGDDYVITRNLIVAWVPACLALAGILAGEARAGVPGVGGRAGVPGVGGRAGVPGVGVGGRAGVRGVGGRAGVRGVAGRAGFLVLAGVCALGLGVTVGVDVNSRYQRDDWRGVARAVPVGSASVVVVTPSSGRIALEYYLPGSRPLGPAGASVRSVEVIALGARGVGNAVTAPPSPEHPAAVAGFGPPVVSIHPTFTVVRYRAVAGSPVVTPATLGGVAQSPTGSTQLVTGGRSGRGDRGRVAAGWTRVGGGRVGFEPGRRGGGRVGFEPGGGAATLGGGVRALALPTAGQRVDRPGVSTAIPNLLLAGDYLDSEWQVGNMEAASYNARRAVNEILDKAGSGESPCAAIGPYQPPEWEPFKQLDAQRYASGQPNFFEAPTELTQDVEQLLDSLNLGQLTQTLGLGSLPI